MKVNEMLYKQSNTIKEVLNPINIKETCPVLLIGKAVQIFKQMYSGQVNELKNTADVKEFIQEYTGKSFSKPVVISDIGYLQRQAAFLLLKLVEEAKFPVILLSTEDTVDSILLSRIKRIVKFPLDENSGNSLMKVSDAFNQVYGENKKVQDKTKFYAENCPQLYQLESEVPYNKYRNGMIEILGGRL